MVDQVGAESFEPGAGPSADGGKKPIWRSGRAISCYWVIAFLVLWQIVTSAGIINKIFLASPSAIASVAYQMFFVTGEIYPHILVSLKEGTLGFVFAIAVGVLLGLAMGRFEGVRRAVEPFVMALYSTPSVALLPLFVLWLGIGLWSKVVIVFLGGVFAILVNTVAGVRSVNPRLIETARGLRIIGVQVVGHADPPKTRPRHTAAADAACRGSPRGAKIHAQYRHRKSPPIAGCDNLSEQSAVPAQVSASTRGFASFTLWPSSWTWLGPARSKQSTIDRGICDELESHRSVTF
jgi:ABC-type nitrate/sulfonate/bicarbonate transport system permease component